MSDGIAAHVLQIGEVATYLERLAEAGAQMPEDAEGARRRARHLRALARLLSDQFTRSLTLERENRELREAMRDLLRYSDKALPEHFKEMQAIKRAQRLVGAEAVFAILVAVGTVVAAVVLY